MSKRCYSEITEDDPRLFVFLQPYPRAKARWNRAKKVFLAGKAKDNTNTNQNRKKKATIQPYLSKGGVKAKDKIPKRRRVVPELREVGYRDTAAKFPILKFLTEFQLTQSLQEKIYVKM